MEKLQKTHKMYTKTQIYFSLRIRNQILAVKDKIYLLNFHVCVANVIDNQSTPSFEKKTTLSSVAAVERLPALHYSVYFIFLSFGIMGFIVEL